MVEHGLLAEADDETCEGERVCPCGAMCLLPDAPGLCVSIVDPCAGLSAGCCDERCPCASAADDCVYTQGLGDFGVCKGAPGGRDTCGAVSGAFMVLGLALAGPACQTAEGRQACCDAVVAFGGAFRRRHGTLDCRDLLGCAMGTPAGAAQARELGLFKTRCPEFVRDAAEIVERMLRIA